jgi:hypothetical protein
MLKLLLTFPENFSKISVMSITFHLVLTHDTILFSNLLFLRILSILEKKHEIDIQEIFIELHYIQDTISVVSENLIKNRMTMIICNYILRKSTKVEIFK